jgi:hypothetical protein
MAGNPSLAARPTALVLSVLWFAALAAGYAMLERYKSTPGGKVEPAATWPSGSVLPRSPHGDTMVLFAHPGCPCTRASVHELDELLTHFGDKLSVVVATVAPQGFLPKDDAGIAKAAAAIPGVSVASVSEQEVERFGVITSGHALLYAENGQLLFSGGITASRGHEGRNAGIDRIAAILSGRTPDRRDSPVFGCALVERNVN